MNIKSVGLAALVSSFILLGASPAMVSAATSDAVKTIAKIILTLNHHPSDGEKTQLKTIATSGSEQEKVLAGAMINLEHKVTDGDKKALEKLKSDEYATAEIKDLAVIMLSLNHTPSDADKKKLSAIAGK